MNETKEGIVSFSPNPIYKSSNPMSGSSWFSVLGFRLNPRLFHLKHIRWLISKRKFACCLKNVSKLKLKIIFASILLVLLVKNGLLSF